jgi:DNA-binding NarL/FixJ family response regulator
MEAPHIGSLSYTAKARTKKGQPIVDETPVGTRRGGALVMFPGSFRPVRMERVDSQGAKIPTTGDGSKGMKSPIRVLIVDDHELVRAALRERLQREPKLEVVGEAATAEEAVDEVARLRPDIVLMDIDMPGMTSFSAAEQIHRIRPDTRIIFLSAYFHDRYIEQALAVKARGYLTKRESPTAVVAAILEVMAGGACFSEEIRSRIVLDPKGVKLTSDSKSRASTLTARELEVLRYLAHGLAKKEIAKTMHISVKTVDRHSVNLMNKLDIHDRVELARFAIREGLAEA